MAQDEVYIEIDGGSGFCFGVVNAISRAESSLAQGEVFSLGDIVHNGLEVRRLEAMGLHTVRHDELPRLGGRRLLIRAHGEPPSTYEEARRLGIEVIDATCPVVAGLQRLVAAAYREMQACGGQVVILGKRGHAEVVGLDGHADGHALIVECEDDLEAVDFSRPVYFLSQTTQSLALFERMAEVIRSRSSCPDKVVIRDTICRQVASRESKLREFASRFDVVIFVCGSKSSNGKVLYGVCRESNPHSHKIEGAGELEEEWFRGCRSVGICGATSTPQWLMEEVAEAIRSITSGVADR